MIVSRIVCITYHTNPNKLPKVYHIDNDTNNIHCNNLLAYTNRQYKDEYKNNVTLRKI